MKSALKIHLVTDENLEDYARIRNTIWTEWPMTVAELKHENRVRDPRCRCERWLGEIGGQITALAEYEQNVYNYHPQRFSVHIGVLPEFRRRGMGTELYDFIVEQLRPSNPIKLSTLLCELWDDSLIFAQKRGYKEELREQYARLDAARFTTETPTIPGIRITNMGELSATDPEMLPKLYDLATTVARDIPAPEPIQPSPYETWIKLFDNPNHFPEGTTIAIEEITGQYVGLTVLRRQESNLDLQQAITGVRREYRRRGIARAMKLHGIAAALKIGATGIRTDNEVNNIGMLRVNQSLGFTPMPAWMHYGCTLG
jgi:mycothiol synthase